MTKDHISIHPYKRHMNLEFLVTALVIGKAVDWIFQSKYQAQNKISNFWALFEHSMFYSIITTGIVIMIVGISTGLLAGFIWISLLVSHIIIDNRFLVKFIMYMKGMTLEEANSKEYGWLQIGIDQRLHDVVILLITMVI